LDKKVNLTGGINHCLPLNRITTITTNNTGNECFLLRARKAKQHFKGKMVLRPYPQLH
jgi:hypothetical protein